MDVGGGPSPEAPSGGDAAGAHPGSWVDVAVVSAGPGRATVTAVVGPHHVNLLGVCHGGVLFSLADRAAVAAAGGSEAASGSSAGTAASQAPAAAGDRAGRGAVSAVSSGSTIELVSPAQLGASLRAESHEVHARGSTAVYDTTVTADGVVVALVRTRLRVRRPAAS